MIVKVTPIAVVDDEEGGYRITLGTVDAATAQAFGCLIGAEQVIEMPFDRPRPAAALVLHRDDEGA